MSLNGELGEPLGSSWDDEPLESSSSSVLGPSDRTVVRAGETDSGTASSSSSSSSSDLHSASNGSSSSAKRLLAQVSSSSSSSASSPMNAVYTVTLNNSGTKKLERVEATHGTVLSAYGFTLDTVNSTPGCTTESRNTKCTLSLEAGETKDLTIVYRTTGKTDCTSASILKTVDVTGSESLAGSMRKMSTLTANTRCEMRSEQSMISSSSSSSLPMQQFPQQQFPQQQFPGQQFPQGQPLQQQFPQNGQPQQFDQNGMLIPQAPVSVTAVPQYQNQVAMNQDGSKPGAFKQEYKPGFKPSYKPYHIPKAPPRSGTAHQYYAFSKSDFVLVKKQMDSEFSLAPMLLLSLVSIALLGLLAHFGYRKLKG